MVPPFFLQESPTYDTHRKTHRGRTPPAGTLRHLVCGQALLRADQRVFHLQASKHRHGSTAQNFIGLASEFLFGLSGGTGKE